MLFFNNIIILLIKNNINCTSYLMHIICDKNNYNFNVIMLN